ncbi:hypothetical protein FUT83_10060 [Treponema phagedenis]|nr:hypothetical protein FUT83_10060 [Treponema phagedenis]QEK09726.1 hypothetical protein FUT81_09965 [Treponema phagedenis]
MEFCNGGQSTIGMLKSAAPYCLYPDFYNRKLITKYYSSALLYAYRNVPPLTVAVYFRKI